METVNEILGSLTEDHLKYIGYSILALLALTAVPWVLWHVIKNAPYFIAWISKAAFFTLFFIGIVCFFNAFSGEISGDDIEVEIEKVENAPKAIIVPE